MLSDATPSAAVQFPYRASTRSIRNGLVGAVVLSAGLEAWILRSQPFDPMQLLMLVGSVVIAVGFVGWSTLRRFRKAALESGAIELDASGLRWRRGDGAIGFEGRWDELRDAVIDARKGQLLLHRADGQKLLIGDPSGSIELERFPSLVREIVARVPERKRDTSAERPAAGKLALYGLGAAAFALALYAANRGVGHAQHWHNGLVLIPALVAGFAALLLSVALRVALGGGPLVSQIYRPGYPRALARFFIVSLLSNALFVWFLNAGTRLLDRLFR